VGKSKGRRPLKRTRRRWKDIIEKSFREIGWGDTDWINLASDRGNTIMNI
jgi:hypothetical protein